MSSLSSRDPTCPGSLDADFGDPLDAFATILSPASVT